MREKERESFAMNKPERGSKCTIVILCCIGEVKYNNSTTKRLEVNKAFSSAH